MIGARLVSQRHEDSKAGLRAAARGRVPQSKESQSKGFFARIHSDIPSIVAPSASKFVYCARFVCDDQRRKRVCDRAAC